MRNTRRGGGGGRGLAARARANAASRLLDADVVAAVDIESIPVPLLPPLPLIANSRLASAAKARASLNKELNELSSSDDDDKDINSKDDDGGDDNDGSIATKTRGGVDDDSDGGEKEVAVDDGELNEDEIEDPIDLFGAGDDDNSIGSGMNDYAAQSYEFFDCIWHWMDPFPLITDKNRRAVEACILS